MGHVEQTVARGVKHWLCRGARGRLVERCVNETQKVGERLGEQIISQAHEIKLVCERLLEQKDQAYEQQLAEKDLHITDLQHAVDTLSVQKDHACSDRLTQKVLHVEDLQLSGNRLHMYNVIFFVIVALIMVCLAILTLHQSRAQEAEKRRLEAELSKCEGIIQEKDKNIQEKDKRIRELQKQHSSNGSEQQDAHRVQAQHAPQQPFVYAFPGLLPSANTYKGYE